MERAGLYLPLRTARAARTGVARPVRRPARGIPRHRRAQELISIIARGYPEVPAVAVDGIFGSATESAVSVIQTLLGLPATGAVGPLTWEGMARLAADVEASSRSAEGQYPGYVLSEEE